MVADMAAWGRPWVWKDPALSFFLPFWKAFWDAPVYVVAVRDPRDVAISWQRFVLPPGIEASKDLIHSYLLRWQYITTLILTHTALTPNRIFVRYESVIADPVGQALRLARFLTESTGATEAPGTTLREMAQAVDPALWRNRSQGPFGASPEASDAQKGICRLLCALVEDPCTQADLSAFPMPEGWRETVVAAEDSVGELCHNRTPSGASA